jgi:HSP20 family protein
MVRNSLSPMGGLYGRDPFFSLQRDMNRLFDDALRGFSGMTATGQQRAREMVEARMNASETDKELRISAELPGVEEKDVDITLDGDVLTIRGEKRFEQERGSEGENYHFVERSYGSFQRSLQLPYSVKAEEIRAEFHNGVLTLTLPKGEQQRTRKIPIGGAQAAQPQIEAGQMEGGGGKEPPPDRTVPGADEQPTAH